jgi:membrane fusion protein, multidrug efflux system
MHNPLIRIGIVLALTACVPLLAACGADAGAKAGAEAKAVTKADAAPGVPVEVAAVAVGPLAPSYVATTNLEAEREAQVRAEVAGEVVAVLVEEGDRVTAGQVLARIDNRHQAIELRQARSVLERLDHDTRRNERLVARRMISREAYDRTRYEQEVQRAAAGLAANTLGKTEIRAPYAGVVTRRWVKEGQWLKLQEPAFDLADFDDLRARVDVPERASGLIKPGQPVSFTADALSGATFTATVERIAPVVDRTSGTVGAIVRIDNRDGALRPGLFVRLAIEYQRVEDATLMPRIAVIANEASAHVFVVDGGKARKRDVTLGVEHGETVQVLAGVAPGTTVVTLGQQSLEDGDAVTIVGGDKAVADADSTASL